MESCTLKSEVSLTNNCQDILNSNSLSKTKSKKSKDNQLIISDNISNDITNSKKKMSNANKDEDECNMQKKENVEEKQKSENIKNDTKGKETSPSNDVSKKYNTKEVKEEKNKADTRHRNRGKAKKDAKENKENVASLTRNKQQLPTQVHTVMHT